MKKMIFILAALMLAGCGKVDDFSRKEGVEHKTETIPVFTFTPADEAEEDSAEVTEPADESVPEPITSTVTEPSPNTKKKARTTTKKAEETTAATTLIGSTPPADTETKKQTEQPKETYATPTVQPRTDPKTEDKQTKEKQQPKDPDFHSDIYQPAWFISQSYEANWEKLDKMRDGSKEAVIRSVDELRAYMEPIYPEDFINERVKFYTKEIFYGEDFFDNNVLIVNTLTQGSGTESMVQIDRIEPSDSMINIKYSWKYEAGCAYAEVMSVCFLQVTAAKPYITDSDARPKGILWTETSEDKYTLTTEDKSIFAQLNALTYTPVTCDGLPEYTLSAPDGTFYQINLSGKWVWKNMKDEEAQLPDELVSWLRENGERIGMTVAVWN